MCSRPPSPSSSSGISPSNSRSPTATAASRPAARGDWARVTAVLREQGVRAPCVLQGNTSVIPLAYVSGCVADPRSGPERPTVLVLRNGQPPPWARDWRSHPVPDTYAPGWTVLVPPGTAIRNTPTDMRS